MSLAIIVVAGLEGCYAFAKANGDVPPLEFKSVAMIMTGHPTAEI